MKRNELKTLTFAAALVVSFSLHASQGGAGGQSGGDGGAGGDGAVIMPPKVTPEQIKAAEANMTAEQRKMFDELVELELSAMKSQGRTLDDIKKISADEGFKFDTEAELLVLIRT